MKSRGTTGVRHTSTGIGTIRNSAGVRYTAGTVRGHILVLRSIGIPLLLCSLSVVIAAWFRNSLYCFFDACYGRGILSFGENVFLSDGAP